MASWLKFCTFCGERMVEKELVRDSGTESSHSGDTGRPWKDVYRVCPKYDGDRTKHSYQWQRTVEA